MDLIALQWIVYAPGRRGDGRSPGIDASEPVTASRAVRVGTLGVIGTLVSLCVAVWFYGIQYYPLSSFPMYSSVNHDGKAVYYEVWGVDATGLESRIDLREGMPVFRDARHRDLLKRTFGADRDTVMLVDTYQRLASLYPVMGPFVHLEIRRRAWVIEGHYGAGRPGQTTDAFVVPLRDDDRP